MSVDTMLQANRSPLLRDRTAAAATTGSWPLAIALAALIAVSALLVAPVTTTPEWVVPAAIGAAVTMFVSQTVRYVTGSMGWASGAVYVSVIAVLLVAAQPTSFFDVFAVVGQRFVEFGQQIGSDMPPLKDSPAVTFVAVLLVQVVTILVDLCAFTLRMPLLSLLPLLAFPTLTVVAGRPAAPVEQWLIALALVLAVLYISARWSRQCEDTARGQLGYTADRRGTGGLGGALMIGGATLGVAALIAVMLPPASGVWWQHLAPNASLSTNRVNPIIDLGDDLRRGEPVQVLSYATSQTEGTLPYLSLTTLGDFSDGSEWKPADFEGAAGLPNQLRTEAPAELGGESMAVGPEQNVNIILESGVTPYLPHFTALDGYAQIGGDYEYDPATGDAREADIEARGQSYHVTTAPIRPSDEELVNQSPIVPEALEPYLELPDEGELAQLQAAIDDVVTPSATPYEQALQLQQWFVGGAFEYSEQAPVSGGYDGTSVEVIERFLEMRSGYCVHFASSMAVMGRMIGIPTRVQVGFTPGTLASSNSIGQSVYEVTSDNLHAWAEFWVPGYGWVSFETTPAEGLGELPSPQVAAPEETQNPSAPPTVETPPTLSSTPTPTPTPTEAQAPADETNDNRSTPAAAEFDWTPALLIAGVVALIAALAAGANALPGMLRRRKRRVREQRVRDQAAGAFTGPDAQLAAAAAAWREVVATAHDHGLRVSGGTVGVQSEHLQRQLEVAAAQTGELGEAQLADTGATLQRLGPARDHAAFADPAAAGGPTANWEDVELVSAAIAEATGPEAQRRARRRPASLRAASKRRNLPWRRRRSRN